MDQYNSSHILSSYYAPRGHQRMFALGMQLAQQYLRPTDKLIGIIGDSGSGKSALIRGMFPGLELTNDDNGVYVRPLPILEQDRGFAFFSPHTYHLDIRFENGFTQMTELADAIAEALHKGRRVVVEHFDLVYPILGANANLLIGVGEQILVARPNLFGPEPEEIREVVYKSLHYRLMAHTAEDICEMCLGEEFDMDRCGHDDVKHGFALHFPDHKPNVDLKKLEAKINDIIAQDLPITYVDENHISIGGKVHPCSGPRIHVPHTGLIKNFRLMHHYIYDRFRKHYILAGCVGENSEALLKSLDGRHQRPGWE